MIAENIQGTAKLVLITSAVMLVHGVGLIVLEQGFRPAPPQQVLVICDFGCPPEVPPTMFSLLEEDQPRTRLQLRGLPALPIHDETPQPVLAQPVGDHKQGQPLSVYPSKLEIENFVTGKSFRGPKFPDQESFGIDAQWRGSFAGIDLSTFRGSWWVKNGSHSNREICVTITERDGRPVGPAKHLRASEPFCRTVHSLDQDRLTVADAKWPDRLYDLQVVGRQAAATQATASPRQGQLAVRRVGD